MKALCLFLLFGLSTFVSGAPLNSEEDLDDYQDFPKRAYHMSPNVMYSPSFVGQGSHGQEEVLPMTKRSSWNNDHELFSGIPMFKRSSENEFGDLPMFKRGGLRSSMPMFKRHASGYAAHWPMFKRDSSINHIPLFKRSGLRHNLRYNRKNRQRFNKFPIDIFKRSLQNNWADSNDFENAAEKNHLKNYILHTMNPFEGNYKRSDYLTNFA